MPPLRQDYYYRVCKDLPPGLKKGEIVCVLIMRFELVDLHTYVWEITLKRADNDFIEVTAKLPDGRIKDYFEPYLENKKWKRRAD
jgi:hypothetical protein